MILDGKIDLNVPAEKAWDFLIDINKFSTCLPDIDELKQIDDKDLRRNYFRERGVDFGEV